MLKKLGNTDINVSSIIMGCWQIGGPPHWHNISDDISIKAINSCIDFGINTFDTAPGYGNGHSEKILGLALKNKRNSAVMATKVFANNLSYDKVLTACENSLINLKTDFIDIFQVHFPSGSFDSMEVPIEETMSAFNKLKMEGKIRAIGVSNFSLNQLQQACKYAEIDSIQPPYSLFWIKSASEVSEYCISNNISILAYSPLAQGLLTGKFNREHKFLESEVRSQQVLCEPDNYARVQDALDELRPIAKSNGMSLCELSLSWIISQPKTLAIVGIRTPEQSYQNSKAMNLLLSNKDLLKISEIGKTVTNHLNNDVLMWNF